MSNNDNYTSRLDNLTADVDKLVDRIMALADSTIPGEASRSVHASDDKLHAILYAEIADYMKDHLISYQQLEHRRNTAERLANTDALTGLANRRALDLALPNAEADPEISVIRFDLNNFGRINKSHYDEPGGDAALCAIAECLVRAAADYDCNRVFRRGGDEFVILTYAEKADLILYKAIYYVQELLNSDEPIPGHNGKYYDTQLLRDLEIGIAGAVGATFAEGGTKLAEMKAKTKVKAHF